MSHRSIRRVASAVSVLVLAATVLASSGAAARLGATCGARAGKTVLENAVARVFTARDIYYACALNGTNVHKLGDTDPVYHVELAGPYVAWELNRYEPGGTLHLLDVRAATGQTVATLGAMGGLFGSSALPFFVLTDHGTIVWVLSRAGCNGGSTGCTVTSTVRERSPNGTRTLAQVTEQGAAYPITSLAISTDDSTVYWTANGAYEGAPLG